jgi:hypothetical protein
MEEMEVQNNWKGYNLMILFSHIKDLIYILKEEYIDISQDITLIHNINFWLLDL